jgi:hypothetical protein
VLITDTDITVRKEAEELGLTNLLGNAVKFVAQGVVPEVRIREFFRFLVKSILRKDTAAQVSVSRLCVKPCSAGEVGWSPN